MPGGRGGRVGALTDRALLYAAAFLRATATAMMAVLRGLHLARRGLDTAALGLVISAGLAGAATASLAVTLAGDGVGRRRALMALTALGMAGAAVAALADQAVAIGLAAFVGMLNGMGRDRGAARVRHREPDRGAGLVAGRPRGWPSRPARGPGARRRAGCRRRR